jgi:hypothetical protein
VVVEPPGAGLIVGALVRLSMALPVDLDGQPVLVAIEIQDEAVERVLAAAEDDA